MKFYGYKNLSDSIHGGQIQSLSTPEINIISLPLAAHGGVFPVYPRPLRFFSLTLCWINKQHFLEFIGGFGDGGPRLGGACLV